MASDLPPQSKWLARVPSAFDIVTAYYPETNPKGELRLRPCLVLDVLKGRTSGKFALRVAYGTRNLQVARRSKVDLIIQNHRHLNDVGLPTATRFSLNEADIVALPWAEEFFGCWHGHSHPIIGSLTETYIRDYAYCMALRQSVTLDKLQ